MSFWRYQPYRSVAQKRADAKKTVAKLSKAGGCSPVMLAGTKIATSFWGKAWCKHIEGWQDYENRLPRGRSYVRSGAVVDLRLTAGEINAKVQGSSLYKIKITVTQLPTARWQTFKQLSLGKVGSLLGLMQGKLPGELLEQLTDPEAGLFPRKPEMKLHCDCPDYSSLCKHLAAVLYGVGNRLDTQPELLFTLRGVEHTELISQAATAAADLGTASLGDSALSPDDDLGAIFGIELAGSSPPPAAPASKPAKKAAAKKHARKTTGKATAGKPAAKTGVTQAATKTALTGAKKPAGNVAAKAAKKAVKKQAPAKKVPRKGSAR